MRAKKVQDQIANFDSCYNFALVPWQLGSILAISNNLQFFSIFKYLLGFLSDLLPVAQERI